MLGWGSTYGSIRAAANRLRAKGKKVAIAHLRYLNPFPKNLGEVVRAYHRSWSPSSTPASWSS